MRRRFRKWRRVHNAPTAAIAVVVAILAVTFITVGLVRFGERVGAQAGDLQPLHQAPFSQGTEGEPPVALWIGDSYTLGAGALDQGVEGYVPLSCGELGWTCYSDARGGTGYGSGEGDRMGKRIALAKAEYIPDIVVVDMGRNDHTRSMPAIEEAVGPALTRLRAAFPKAKIVLISPFYAVQAADPMPAGFADYYRAQADRIGADIIDPCAEGWAALPTGMQYPDHVHPNTKGYAVYATRLAADFKKLGLAAPTA